MPKVAHALHVCHIVCRRHSNLLTFDHPARDLGYSRLVVSVLFQDAGAAFTPNLCKSAEEVLYWNQARIVVGCVALGQNGP